MKFTLTILIIIFLVGCGTTQSAKPTINPSAIVWQGYADEDAKLLAIFNETMSCLNSLYVYKIGYPYVFIVKNLFACGQYQNAAGCTSENDIYLWQTSVENIFGHEIVHWATGLGVESENTIYFTQCQFSPSAPFCNPDGTIPAGYDFCRTK